MDQEIKDLLQKNLAASVQTQALLHKVHHILIWQRVFSLAKWVVFVLILLIGFVKFEPYVGNLLKDYENVFKALEHLNTVLPAGI